MGCLTDLDLFLVQERKDKLNEIREELQEVLDRAPDGEDKTELQHAVNGLMKVDSHLVQFT